MLRYMDRLDWYRECMDSLRPAMESGVICLHQIQGYPGHVGRGRAVGYMQGSAPYVSHVDPDDIYNPAVFAVCADYLDEHPAVGMVYTVELILHPDGTLVRRRTPMDITRVMGEPAYAHGVKVFRRGAIMPLLGVLREAEQYAEWKLTRAMVQAGHQVAHIDEWGRHWRQHPGQMHRIERRSKPGTLPPVGSEPE